MSINNLFALLKFRVNCANVSLHTRSKIVDQTVCALDVLAGTNFTRSLSKRDSH